MDFWKISQIPFSYVINAKINKFAATYLWIDESICSIISQVLYCSGSSRNLTIPSFWLIVANISPSWI